MNGKTLAIVGGGLAGMAAALEAAQRGLQVELFEQTASLGGRAGSFFDPLAGRWIDHCRHVGMGCCTHFLDFCRRAGLDDCFERVETYHFIDPDGRRHDFTPSRWLPAPLHLLPGLMNLKFLSLGERWKIAGALLRLQRTGPVRAGVDSENASSEAVRSWPARGKSLGRQSARAEETIGGWLRRRGQSDRAIERFWSLVLESALSETVDHAALSAARMVFQNAFLAPRGASDLIVPRMALRDIFHVRAGKSLRDRGVAIHAGVAVRRIARDGREAIVLTLADGSQQRFDAAIAAVPWRRVRRLFDETLWAAMPRAANVDRIEPAAITAVHLWFDRPILGVPRAVLVGRLSQWVFSEYATATPGRECVTGRGTAEGGCTPCSHATYCQVVISASHRRAALGREALLAEVRRELEAVWRGVERKHRDAGESPPRLLHARVVVRPAAVFSVAPGAERFRPPQRTPLGNLALAGDWTDTGWPGTMEGAILSGRRAVEAIVDARGK